MTTNTNEKAAGAINTNGLHTDTNEPDYPTGQRPCKALETLRAKFSMRGHLVHDGGNHDFIVVHRDWGHSRHCPDYSALVRFGRVLGVFQ